MNTRLPLVLLVLGLSLFCGCSNSNHKADASGTFEAVEVLVSSEAAGILKRLDVVEGDTLAAGKSIGVIDSLPLVLKRKQVKAQISAVLSRTPDAATQLATLTEQIATARHEKDRFEKLLASGSGTKKIVDDASAQVRVLEKQFEALKKQLEITTNGLHSETLPLLAQLDQLNDQISRCSVVNPINGTVLAKYAEAHEICAPGKALYKIADLRVLNLRAYINGAMLSRAKLGATVRISIDDGNGTRTVNGTIAWISSKAEFTPKTIQTKDERANLVYAMKIAVVNDGSLKIGMYGEVVL